MLQLFIELLKMVPIHNYFKVKASHVDFFFCKTGRGRLLK